MNTINRFFSFFSSFANNSQLEQKPPLAGFMGLSFRLATRLWNGATVFITALLILFVGEINAQTVKFTNADGVTRPANKNVNTAARTQHLVSDDYMLSGNPPQNEPRFAPNRVLVKLANTPAMRSMTTIPGVAQSPPDLGVGFSEIRLLNPSKGNASIGTFSTMSVNDKQNNVYVLTLEETGEDAVDKALKKLNANPAVEIAEPVFYYKLFKTPNDPMFSQQYALEKINALQAWGITTGIQSVVVGIIDTGIDGAHPDLADNLWINPNPNQNGYMNDIHGYDFVNRIGGIPTDLDGHGTHVAGIIGAKGNNGTGIAGVNWNVSLAWLGISEGWPWISIDSAIEALNYANNNNIPITNNSYGGGDYSAIFEDAIRNYNGLFVAAAGNNTADYDLYPCYPAGYNLPNVISVASTDQNDNLSWFTNYGENSVHIAAPGSEILSTLPGGQYEELSGTSMAAPYVAGVAALIQPDLSPVQIKEILITTARRTSSLNGFGILDAHAAVSLAPIGNFSSTIDLSQSVPPSTGLGWSYSNNVYTVRDGAHITITGNNDGSTRRVEVMAGATVYITLENASITGLSANQTPLLLGSGANVTLTLVGINTFTAGSGRAGIQVPQSATLAIIGAGSLAATGGSSGAGIGGGSGGAGGNIIINGGVVTAIGIDNGQGIGSGSGSEVAGTFTMNGNAIVIANSVGDVEVSRRTGGILFAGVNGTFYSESVTMSANVTIPADLTIPANRVLIVSTGVTLIIPAEITLTNNGVIINFGTIIGTVSGNPSITDYPNINMIDLSVNNPFPHGDGWTFTSNVYTVLDGANVTFTGTSANQRRISVVANATANITLNNVTIQRLISDQSPLLLNNGADVTLTLLGTNTFLAGSYIAGIQTPQGTTLTITGAGSLDVAGGWGAAGIGGGSNSNNSDCGNITISGGIVTATGAYTSYIDCGGAGIGGGTSGEGGTITISGGVVIATGYDGGPGIGGSGSSKGGTLTMSGNAIVFTNRVSDMSADRKKGGILVTGSTTQWYGGNNFSLSHNMTLPGNHFLTIGEEKILTIPSGMTLTNDGMIINYGGITINGTLTNNGVIVNYGIITGTAAGNTPILGIPHSNSIDLSNDIPFPWGNGWSYENNVYTVSDGADVIITGTSANSQRIEVATNATAIITLSNVSIPGLNNGMTPLLLNDGAAVNLMIEGDNIFVAGHGRTGIQVPQGTKLVIGGKGRLEATGMAGIGGGDWGEACGNITINGGTVTANGGSGAGIGGAPGGAGGNISINDGTITATGDLGAGIGGGYYGGAAGMLTMTGNAVIFASSVDDMSMDRKKGGILFAGNNGYVYGSVEIAENLSVPFDHTLTVDAGKTLIIPAGRTLTNNGTVYVCGTINKGGSYGEWAGNEPVPGGYSDNSIDLSIINLLPPCDGSWMYANNTYIIQNGATVTITGTNTNQRRIEVAANATANITLNSATIQGLDNTQSPLLLNSGANVTLTLEGTSMFEAGVSCAGIQTTDATLTITGTGSLTATGNWGGAGIGGGTNGAGGNITINGGTITTTGDVGAGIGGGYDGAGGNITINGGTITTTGNRGAGIGGGYDGAGGNITINGGTITATGDWSGGIGGTLTMNGNAIVFTNDVSDTDESTKTGGLLFIGNNATGTFYGNSVTITDDVELPDGFTLIVDVSKTLTIPAGKTLTNYGTVYSYGTINYDGEYGVWVGNPPIVMTVNAVAPNITIHPQPATYMQNSMATALTVTATVSDGGTLSYQWYSNTENSIIGGTAVGDNSAIYTPPTTTTGTMYYYVVVTNTNNSVSGTQIATTTSVTAEITVTEPSILQSPAITGTIEMILQEGYKATSTDEFTITGTDPVTVTITDSNTAITWNDDTKKLDIAEGLTVGEYMVELTASNGIEPDATLIFTLTIKAEPVIPAIIDVTVTPSTVSVHKGMTQQFTADVTTKDGASEDVTWSVTGNNSTGTFISNDGLLTVADDETADTFTVTATSDFDNTKFDTATVTVIVEFVTPAVIDVMITPATISVHKGMSQQFTADVTTQGDASTAVTWSISGHALTATNISASGLLTIAAGETATRLTVRATSNFDNTKYDEATVTVENVTSIETQSATSLRAWKRNGLLHVTGLSVGETLSVYTAAGALVYHCIAASGEADIPLKAQGVYIVRNGDRMVRVVFE